MRRGFSFCGRVGDCITLRPVRLLILLLSLALFTGCATRSLPKYEPRLKRADHQRVRTTAYTHSEKDHRKWGRKTAMGTPLLYDEEGYTSAAADWSRWPAGTRFRVVETDRYYEIDDYGWALAGRNTIDLYKPNKRHMRDWGVRHVTIEILHWGNARASYKRMRPARKHKHVRRMMKDIERYH